MTEIKVEPEQITNLLNIYSECAGANDIETAVTIYNKCFEKRLSEWGADNIEFCRSSALGAVLRVGYILGLKAERRHTHTRQLQTNNNAAHNGGKHND